MSVWVSPPFSISAHNSLSLSRARALSLFVQRLVLAYNAIGSLEGLRVINGVCLCVCVSVSVSVCFLSHRLTLMWRAGPKFDLRMLDLTDNRVRYACPKSPVKRALP